MPATELSALISPRVPDAVSTGAATDARITRSFGREDETIQKWQAVIEDRLIEWGRDSSEFEDEGIQPPSMDTIQLAILLAKTLSRANCPAPTRVVPDADAGIVFERHEGGLLESLRLSADGSVEYCRFENARLVDREFRPPHGA